RERETRLAPVPKPSRVCGPTSWLPLDATSSIARLRNHFRLGSCRFDRGKRDPARGSGSARPASCAAPLAIANLQRAGPAPALAQRRSDTAPLVRDRVPIPRTYARRPNLFGGDSSLPATLR